jgi:hypothetical protein
MALEGGQQSGSHHNCFIPEDRTLAPTEKMAGWAPELGLIVWRREKFPTPAINQSIIL